MKEFDPDGDGMISCWECKQALGHLNIPEDQCEMLMDSMKDHFGSDVKTKPWPIEAWLDYFQELYVNARDANNIDLSPVSIISRLQRPSNHLRTKKTFVEIFNDLDTDKDGFISEDEVKVFLDGDDWKRPLTEKEKLGFLKNAGPTDNFRFNLFQFMSNDAKDCPRRYPRDRLRLFANGLGIADGLLAWHWHVRVGSFCCSIARHFFHGPTVYCASTNIRRY